MNFGKVVYFLGEQPHEKDYFFSFDDNRLGNFTVEHFQQLYEVFIDLYDEQDYFYFDEMQNIANQKHFEKGLYNSGNVECDWVVRDSFRIIRAIQVYYLLDSFDTRERELRGIRDVMDAYQLPEGIIITNTHEEEMRYGDKTIYILPAWKWLRSSIL